MGIGSTLSRSTELCVRCKNFDVVVKANTIFFRAESQDLFINLYGLWVQS